MACLNTGESVDAISLVEVKGFHWGICQSDQVVEWSQGGTEYHWYNRNCTTLDYVYCCRKLNLLLQWET